MPPLNACFSWNVGDTRIQTFVDGTEDYIRWTCTKGTSEPVVYYWRHSIHSSDPVAEGKRVGKQAIIKAIKEGVWQGVTQSGFAAWPTTSLDRAHARYVGAFDLRSWDGTPLNRDMDIHMVVKRSADGGATWTTCADTGWVGPPTPQPQFSYEFYRLSSSCGPTTILYTRSRFLQHSTGTWWVSGWVIAGPASIPMPPPPV